MSSWLYVNIGVFIIVLFSIINLYNTWPLHIIIGVLGLFFILFNWTRHAVFSTIRQTKERKKKIQLANFSKKVMPFHRWVGTSAFILIIFHAYLVLGRYGFNWTNIKLMSGIVAGVTLLFMVLTGWLRLYFPSGRKRRAHLYIGFTLFFLVVLHTIIF